ncbi:unnamed protein product [Musa acuminata subsp. malaccensis]|uniref:(wild Malaysian banana) hypothetical protein n=1 Tax=Musa acuminata subsp. malaccensis TaxID=214687 RepID=A0A804IRE0_MUSAM|nr:unnamed protein product [Musa acuminata subsp. malaccensis]
MDREARVTRYREKSKTRKFEKTMRYASRKAYAKTKPRIKGRFAKKSNAELEVEELLLLISGSNKMQSLIIYVMIIFVARWEQKLLKKI